MFHLDVGFLVLVERFPHLYPHPQDHTDKNHSNYWTDSTLFHQSSPGCKISFYMIRKLSCFDRNTFRTRNTVIRILINIGRSRLRRTCATKQNEKRNQSIPAFFQPHWTPLLSKSIPLIMTLFRSHTSCSNQEFL